MNVFELDMISFVMYQEYGKYDDVMCVVFQYEEVFFYFKMDYWFVVVSDFYLVLCVLGIFVQLYKFIFLLENGMYSCVVFYVGQVYWEYKLVNFGKVWLDMCVYFKGMGEELLCMFIFFFGLFIEVVFIEE